MSIVSSLNIDELENKKKAENDKRDIHHKAFRLQGKIRFR